MSQHTLGSEEHERIRKSVKEHAKIRSDPFVPVFFDVDSVSVLQAQLGKPGG